MVDATTHAWTLLSSGGERARTGRWRVNYPLACCLVADSRLRSWLQSQRSDTSKSKGRGNWRRTRSTTKRRKSDSEGGRGNVGRKEGKRIDEVGGD